MQELLKRHPIQIIWQGAFIVRMDLAYEAADLVISRSGACTDSELQLGGKPTIFVPSPNVAEDHQTQNAMALVRCGAALIVEDSKAVESVMSIATETLQNGESLESLKLIIDKLGCADSAE